MAVLLNIRKVISCNEGRPYYVEHDHRVYMEKKHHGHKKYKKHYKNKGYNNGHGKHS